MVQEEPLASEDEVDPELLAAMQQSLEDQEATELRRAIEASRLDASRRGRINDIPGSNIGASSSRQTLVDTPAHTPVRFSASGSRQDNQASISTHTYDEDLYASPTRLETALSIANAGPKKRTPTKEPLREDTPEEHDFGIPTLLVPPSSSTLVEPEPSEPLTLEESEDDEVEQVVVPAPLTVPSVPPSLSASASGEALQITPKEPPVSLLNSSDEEDMEEVVPMASAPLPPIQAPSVFPFMPPLAGPSTSRSLGSEAPLTPRRDEDSLQSKRGPSRQLEEIRTSRSPHAVREEEDDSELPQLIVDPADDSSDESGEERWSRPASPSADPDADVPPKAKVDEDWDAAQEMDVHAEESEYAQFISQIRGRNLEDEIGRAHV